MSRECEEFPGVPPSVLLREPRRLKGRILRLRDYARAKQMVENPIGEQEAPQSALDLYTEVRLRAGRRQRERHAAEDAD